MRRTLRLSAIAAVLLAVAGVTVASAASSEEEHPAVEVIHAVRTGEETVDLDLGQPGVSLGDQSVFNARVEVGGKPVGFDAGVCTLVKLPAIHQCITTTSLPRGQITDRALLDFDKLPGPAQLAITGGTGAYKSAGGQLDVLFSEGDDQVTFRIISGDASD